MELQAGGSISSCRLLGESFHSLDLGPDGSVALWGGQYGFCGDAFCSKLMVIKGGSGNLPCSDGGPCLLIESAPGLSSSVARLTLGPGAATAAASESFVRTGMVASADFCAPDTCEMSCSAQTWPDPLASRAVWFLAEVSAPMCPWIPEVLWQFGDGASASGKEIRHEFAAPGTYSWSVLVTLESRVGEESGTLSVGGE
jgi:hypothetical protein